MTHQYHLTSCDCHDILRLVIVTSSISQPNQALVNAHHISQHRGSSCNARSVSVAAL